MGNSEICQSISLTGITPWSPDTPKLYIVVSRVLCNGIECDCVRTSVGIRTVRFDKDEGFFLNGEHFSILGANVHQDHAGWTARPRPAAPELLCHRTLPLPASFRPASDKKACRPSSPL